MVVTDGDLVCKLQSLPPEALDELLNLICECDKLVTPDGGEEILERLSDPKRQIGDGVTS